jgi:hypothetical protein
MAAEKRSRQAAGAGRRFAWYGRLSTKDKQEPDESIPSATPRASGRRRRSSRCSKTRPTPAASTGTGSTRVPTSRASVRWFGASETNGSRPTSGTRR